MPAQLAITPPQLVALLKQKSRESFSILYDCYSSALFGQICRIVKDIDAAEDLLQDTFIKIWLKIDMYDEERGSLFTWMLNIANHTSVDYLRSRHKIQKNKRIDIEQSGYEALPSSYDTNGIIIKTELKLFVQQLDTKYRKVIELTFLTGYTHEEVALILSLPLGTVKTRCRYGLKHLRNLYDFN